MTPAGGRARRACPVARALVALATPRAAEGCGSRRGSGGVGAALAPPWQTYGLVGGRGFRSASGQPGVSLGASARYRSNLGFRSGLALSYQPPIDGLSKNAVAATGLTVLIAFTR